MINTQKSQSAIPSGPAHSSKVLRIAIISVGSVVILALAVVIFLSTYTYSVSGKLTNIATHEPLTDVQLTMAGKTTSTDTSGVFTFTGVPIYAKSSALVVRTPQGYEPLQPATPQYSNDRKATTNLTAEPTLKSIAQLMNDASINHQYDFSWTFMHPDSQAYWGSESTYTALLKKRDDTLAGLNMTTKSSAIGTNIRTLPSWTDPLTNKTYKDVFEVPNSDTNVIDGKEQPQTWLDYYQRVGGYYHYFTSVDKTKLQNALNVISS